MNAPALPGTLIGRLRHWARQTPDRIALRDKDRGIWQEITWSEYRDAVQATAHMLRHMGVGPGDHVAILSDNRPEWLYADLGTQAIGARAVGIYQTNPPPDVAYILEHAQCRVLFCEDQEQVDKALEIRAQTPTVEAVVVFDDRGTRAYDDDRLLSWETFLAEGRTLAAADAEWFDAQVDTADPDAPSMVVYTSGTTGQPKGALLTPRNALQVSDSSADTLQATADDTMLSYLPLCHVAEKIFSVFVPLSVGCTVHFGESIETVREDLREVSPSVFLGVPRIWEKMHAGVMLRMKDSSWLKRTLFEWFTTAGRAIAARRRTGANTAWDRVVWFVGDLFVFRALQERLGMRRCRLPVTGAAPISPDLIEWFHGVGIWVTEGFGQTECAGVCHLNPPEAPRLGTVGKPLPGVEQRIAEDGEILIRGAHVFPGYLHNEAATRDTVDADGWLHTGDVGSVDADGYLSITGRKKEIIITAGGKNLSPEKIENALKMSPYVKEAVAIGDTRKFVSALIQIDQEAVSDWATRRAIDHTSFEDLTEKPEVLALVKAAVDTSNETLARVEQVRSFRLFPKELHQDDGELTATQKVRRRAITELYAELIESMYARGGGPK